MRKSIVWGAGIALFSIFTLLLGLQYMYYDRVISLRKAQTRQLSKNALAEVGRDIELREFVRYINEQLREKARDSLSMVSTLSSIVGSVEGEQTDLTESDSIAPPPSWRLGRDKVLSPSFDTLAVSDQLLRAFFASKSSLDEYILRNLYRVYESDSIPQYVSPRYLQDQVRYRLDLKGVTEAYSIALCDANGRVLYEYIQPGMLRRSHEHEDKVLHRLFVNADTPNKLTPYLLLTLDFEVNREEMLTFALPGLISTLVVLLIVVFSVVMLLRQIHFQEMRTSFINNMTHELKTPVSSILLASEMLSKASRDGVSEQRGSLVRMIKEEAQRLKLLIDKTLQMSLFDGKMTTIALKVLDANEYLLKAAEIYSVHAEKRGGRLILDLQAENTWIRANDTHLTNILFNLLDNSVKYSDPSKPLILGIYSYNENGQLVIRIEDNGIGVPKESLKHLFDKYYRVAIGYRHDVKGFGLGLAYVHSVVRSFGGRIIADNKPSGGLVMTIWIPLHLD